jgi:hypothetical protein
MQLKKLFFPLYGYKQYKQLWDHIFNLEAAMEWILNSPKFQAATNVGFNGQQYRKKIFLELMNKIKFDAIIETGTYTGDTTGYMAITSSLPIYTSELNKWFHNIARRRLIEINNIHYFLGDSRKFLENLAHYKINKKKVFIYLDAHWYKDLPLKKEIEIIVNHWDQFIIMIDDFKVPDDEGYTYDHYSRKKSLTMEVFGQLFKKNNLKPFFPSAASGLETGYKRGCVVLTPNGELSKKIEKVSSLRQISSN